MGIVDIALAPTAREQLTAELDRLRAMDHQARELARKVAEHERCGYGRIKLGAFRALRNALEG